MHHPAECGPCVDCQEFIEAETQRRRAAAPAVPGAPAPTKAGLLKHATRFGWDQVRETAEEIGIDLTREDVAKVAAPVRDRTRRRRATARA